jgi:hypothetical protein
MRKYTESDALAWAQFSGDYNPVHFDLLQARAMGLETLTVHGMRVLLDMKNQLNQAITHTASGNYHFSARLRQAVKCGKPHRLETRLNGVIAKSQLTEEASGECCFSGKLQATENPLIGEELMLKNLTATELMAMSKTLPADISETSLWEFFDAVMFERIVQSPETLGFIQDLLPELNARSLAEAFIQVPVVQTHHDVHFSSELLKPCRKLSSFSPLFYRILPTLILGDRQQGFVIRAAIQGRYETNALIMTTITLKTWPLCTSSKRNLNDANYQ